MVIAMNYYFSNQYSDELYHYGVKGMKWGMRKSRELVPRYRQTTLETERVARRQKIKKAAKIGAVVVGAAALAYGGYKLHSIRQSNQAAVGKFIFENGLMRTKTITSVQRPANLNGFSGGKQYTYRHDTLSRSILGPSVKTRSATRGYVGGNRVRSVDDISLYGRGDNYANKILKKGDRNRYAKYYRQYMKGK